MRRIVSVVVLVLGSLLIVEVPAQAAGTETTRSHNFTRTKQWYSRPLERCFNMKMTGTIAATYGVNRRGRWLKNPRISNSKLRVTVRKSCNRAERAKVSKLELRQYYYDRACNVQPSYGVGASNTGLSIGLSATRVCRTFQSGYRQSTYGRSDNYTQNASGNTIRWGKSVNWTAYGASNPYHEVCVTGEFHLQPYRGTNRDDIYTFTFPDICQGSPR